MKIINIRIAVDPDYANGIRESLWDDIVDICGSMPVATVPLFARVENPTEADVDILKERTGEQD